MKSKFNTSENLIKSLVKDPNDKINKHVEFYDRIRSVSPIDSYILEVANWNVCKECRLHTCRTKVVFGAGSLSPKLLIVGEAPGPDEDLQGIPFIGKTGSFLREVLVKVGLDIDDIYFTNAVACIPKDSHAMPFRTPTVEEIKHCSARLQYIYQELLPSAEAVIITGRVAFAAWMALELKRPAIIEETMSARFSVKDQLGWHTNLASGKPAYFIYHPSYIERQGRSKTVTQPWINDIKAVYNYIDKKDLKINNDRILHDHGEKNA